MNALKLFARLLLIVVMIPLVLQMLLDVVFIVFANHHSEVDALSKAVAGCAVSALFLAGLVWAYKKLGRSAAVRQ